ncbi:1-phosphofructokinase [Aquibacillus albus]|uniref:Tagatose-6-phosphate kinase n=1 Tax=Aquibacillus albus TaxID=1168171 RepID=A0ABS2MYT9_9BACI|nr:1-phosphofructokinase [Aquibacillus albus]MBM7571042.1 1-phosphofructokinase [Aquibacillus albus]
MIYTCTLNPSVDYIIHTPNFQAGGLNRGENPDYYPGGKGINVSRVLNRLGVENTALGFLGGFTGDFIKGELKKENIKSNFIEVNGVTRINMKLKSNTETEINGPGASITEAQLSHLYDQIHSMKTGDFLVASGSIPSTVPDNFYVEIANICKEKQVNMIADTSSQALKELIGTELFLVKPNQHELEELFDTTIDSFEDAVSYGKKLHEQGAKHVIVSMGGNGAVYIGTDVCLFANAPKGEVKNSVGAGDSMVAGFLSAFTKTNQPKEAFRYAIATGSATAFSNDLCTRDAVEKLLQQISVEAID